MAGQGSIVCFARIGFAWVPNGVQQNNVPSAQSLALTNDFGANGGYVAVAGGANPTSTQIQNALNTLATNMGATFTNTTNLAVIQGWQNGTG